MLSSEECTRGHFGNHPLLLCCVESAGVFIATFNITSDKSHM